MSIKSKQSEDYFCPVETTVRMIGNKWKLSIIWQLLGTKKRFSELRRNIPGISQKVLTDNLRALESDNLLKRTVFPEVPPRVEYELSEIGETLRPILRSISDWGIKYHETIHPGKEFFTCRSTVDEDDPRSDALFLDGVVATVQRPSRGK
jgi:DNA-binding HxlR family transcriptional regulator